MIGNSSTQFTLRRNRAVYREFLGRPTIVLVAVTSAAMVVALTVNGSPASGTGGNSPLLRLAYYVLCAGIGTVVCYCSAVVALYVTCDRTLFKNVVALAGAMLVVAVPCTAIAHVAQYHLFSIHAALGPLYSKVVSQVLPIALIVYYVAYRRASALPEEVAHRDGRHDPAGGVASADQSRPPAAVGVAQQARFFRRLSVKADGDIVYLKTSGHYLNVYTTAGSRSALMRLADAIDDLDAIGMRVHRSFWVAHAHVARLVRRGERQYLRLSDDSEIPISRTHLAAVRVAFPNLFVRNRGSRTQDSTAAGRPAVSDTGLERAGVSARPASG